jgi:hypothetical protein
MEFYMKFFTKAILTATLCTASALSIQASDAPKSPISPIDIPKLERAVTPIRSFSTEWATELSSLERLVETWAGKIERDKGALVREIIVKSVKQESPTLALGRKDFKDEKGLAGFGILKFPTMLKDELECTFFINNAYIQSLSNLNVFLNNSVKVNAPIIKSSSMHSQWKIVKNENGCIEMCTIKNIPLSDNQRIVCCMFKQIDNKGQKFMQDNPADFPEKTKNTKKRKRPITS